MKNLISVLFVTIIIVTVNSVTAQNNQAFLKNKSGVYMSFSDFKTQKLNLEVDYTKEKHKIKVNEFLNKSDIEVTHQNKKYTFAKKDIYGIRDCNGIDFRFYENMEYKIIAIDTIYLYSKQESENTSGGKTPINKLVTKFYFSKMGDSEILPLTSENIKSAFPENHKMHDALDMIFKNESSLSEYDNFHKKYKIIRFLRGDLK